MQELASISVLAAARLLEIQADFGLILLGKVGL